ncbi:hypothetical protein BGW37DRAFT_503548 [Umbelopsis sp. PMI_123]|nr:hypothetical protein BGW37DRAFT_503548 [Umbelopsis sp. PMI_123]
MQIVLNKPVTTTNRHIPVDALQNVWTSLTRQHPSLNSPPQITLRAFSSVTLATAYSNHIVLNFEQRVKNYLKCKISANFQTLKNALVWKLIEKYALPRIATGNGDWPEDWPEDVSLIMVAIETLSASPGEYIPALKFILLASILPSIRTPQSPSEYINVFYEIFDFRPLRIRR